MAKEEERLENSSPESETERETPQEASGNGAESAGAADLLRQERDEALREKAQFKRLAQRAQADLINERNRFAKERAESEVRAVRRLAGRILDAVDQFDNALSENAREGVPQQWLDGIEAIRRNFESALASQGFERYESMGEAFDPRLHEAILRTPTSSAQPDTVIGVLRPGYMHNGEVFRPAQVQIAAPEEGTDENQ